MAYGIFMNFPSDAAKERWWQCAALLAYTTLSSVASHFHCLSLHLWFFWFLASSHDAASSAAVRNEPRSSSQHFFEVAETLSWWFQNTLVGQTFSWTLSSNLVKFWEHQEMEISCWVWQMELEAVMPSCRHAPTRRSGKSRPLISSSECSAESHAPARSLTGHATSFSPRWLQAYCWDLSNLACRSLPGHAWSSSCVKFAQCSCTRQPSLWWPSDRGCCLWSKDLGGF